MTSPHPEGDEPDRDHERSGISPKRIEFEVTETALMMNIDSALANIHLLRAAGVRIALDDFGTGYSSLSQIQKLPLDKIKVDGSFVRDLASSEASRKIVRSVSALSRDLSLSCVVEGVETREQLDILQDIGCHLIKAITTQSRCRKHMSKAFWRSPQVLRRSAPTVRPPDVPLVQGAGAAVGGRTRSLVAVRLGSGRRAAPDRRGEVRFVGRSFGLPIVSGSFEQIDCKVSVNLKKP